MGTHILVYIVKIAVKKLLKVHSNTSGRRQGTVLCLLFSLGKGDTEPSPVSSPVSSSLFTPRISPATVIPTAPKKAGAILRKAFAAISREKIAARGSSARKAAPSL
jgi:hypothetical protein